MTAVPIKVLMVEDNPLDVQLVRELLRFSAPGAVEITHVECMSEVPAQVKLGTDVVLLDLGLPDAQGPGAVRKARAMAPTVPLVVWTGLEDEALAAQVLKEGAQDYLVKGKLDGDGLLQVLRRSIQRQRTQVETDHIRALQIQLRDEFLSDVSHELRTPLTAIYQFSTIIADGLSGPTTPEQQEHLEIIRRNVEQVRAMIEDLLDAGRAEGGTLSIEPECTSLADVIAYTVTTLQGPAQEKKITLSFEIPPDLPPAFADPKRLRQILIILLDNAIKFTPPGGSVILRAAVDAANPQALRIEVSDTGCGIHPELTEKIFERLYSVEETSRDGRRGLGLGLFICRQLVDGQGGRISVEPNHPQGSVFTFTLPSFSLPRVVGWVIESSARSADPMTSISVAFASSDHAVADPIPNDLGQQVRTIVQDCAPGMVLLLPETGLLQKGEVALVLSGESAAESAALGRQIQEKCEVLFARADAGVSCSVTTTLLEPAPAPETSNQDRIAAVCHRITERIAVQTHEEECRS